MSPSKLLYITQNDGATAVPVFAPICTPICTLPVVDAGGCSAAVFEAGGCTDIVFATIHCNATANSQNPHSAKCG